MGRPSRPLLSRESIARAALDTVDEQGADGLTMRAVADRLGVKAASLYNHVSGKDELIDALAELVNAEIDLGPLAPAAGPDGAHGPGVGSGSDGGAGADADADAGRAGGATDRGNDWRAGVAAYARGYRAAFLRHPHTIALLARRRVGAERQLLGYDTLLAALGRAGLTPADAAEAAAALDYLVLGSALETFTAGFARPAAEYRPGYPALAGALEASAERSGGPGGDAPGLDERGFELALRLLLDGLAARPA
ncbi:TetR/AcrR family transcriptional regulator C-terminal domain-containing protein [Kitasatospora sp. A2-31]|uniref:TetR/AcrR family transcriptional regulator C-terminal domain-containing protein n=1 Tax=Kitasatospora sp. A2-31 TaxID=2916414 RepID=UPI001EE78FB4|nr:TetR/AcrR family transcriptional regulator C-terminal domain-containing protein [Kitasatospora sp. A2-31]MCG6492904.1 TetR/AcrR family transcriptional regulator C-terminal domain-containing protein [Kitasatospora sp. A2-31]